jgi:hypothetical protein
MKVTMVLEGHPVVLKNIQRMRSVITRQGSTSGWNGAQHLFARTRAVVPYLSGELYDAAYIANVGRPNFPAWVVGYDTVAVPHAMVVHETPNRVHPTRGPSSEPKQDHYLSEPRDAMEKSFPRTVESDMKKAIAGTYMMRTARRR